MKNKIREFIEPSLKEKQDLWKSAVFVFDTNVLLNLYRYSAKTRDSLLEAFDSLKERVWIPYQVAYEFMNLRCEVIYETVLRYDQYQKDVNSFITNTSNTLRLTQNDDEIIELRRYLDKWLASNKENNLLVVKADEDEILDKVLYIFDNRVGDKVEEGELNLIKEEGKKRYEDCIPPGYKDGKKKKENNDNNAYGDLIIWKQIIKYAKEKNVGIIYITHDQKEDWWNVVKGKTIGPRIELRREFYNETNQEFHMYSMSSFIEAYNRLNKVPIDESAVEEIKDMDYGSGRYKVKWAKRPPKEADKIVNIENTLEKIENRIQRRERIIKSIDEKYRNKGLEMPDDVRTQYDNTNAKLEELHHTLFIKSRELEVLKKTFI